MTSQVLYTGAIPAHRRQKQEDHEFNASLGYTVIPSLEGTGEMAQQLKTHAVLPENQHPYQVVHNLPITSVSGNLMTSSGLRGQPHA